MNIGPKGDGTFATEDRQILDAIAKWWKVNGNSIRGTERTPLAPQSWGESTLKGNDLYLHVFEWPEDGKLLVGGLNAEVVKATLLADPKTPLPIERIGPDLEITLPASSPDAANSVIVLDCKTRPRGDSAQLLQTNTTNKLSIFTAELLGPVDRKGWSLGKGTSITSHAKGWKTKDCAVRWKTRLTRLTRLPACRPACLQVMALVQVLDNLDQYGVGQVGAGADAGGRASEWSGVGCGAVGHCTPHATCCMLRRLVDCGPLICRSCCRSWLSLCWTPSLAAGAVLPEQQVQRGIHAGHGQQQHLLPRGCC